MHIPCKHEAHYLGHHQYTICMVFGRTPECIMELAMYI